MELSIKRIPVTKMKKVIRARRTKTSLAIPKSRTIFEGATVLIFK
jgi:hypothetical protein